MYLKKQAGIATALFLAAVAASFGIGMYFKHYTDHVDHPLEQFSEKVLEANDIDIDFSSKKKEAANKQ